MRTCSSQSVCLPFPALPPTPAPASAPAPALAPPVWPASTPAVLCRAATTLYLFTSLCVDVASVTAALLSGLPVLPQFDKPYLSSSLRWVLLPVQLQACVGV